MMVVIKEPGVNVALAERCLYGGKIHGQITILNNARVLSESGTPLATRRPFADSMTLSLRVKREFVCSGSFDSPSARMHYWPYACRKPTEAQRSQRLLPLQPTRYAPAGE